MTKVGKCICIVELALPNSAMKYPGYVEKQKI